MVVPPFRVLLILLIQKEPVEPFPFLDGALKFVSFLVLVGWLAWDYALVFENI